MILNGRVKPTAAGKRSAAGPDCIDESGPIRQRAQLCQTIRCGDRGSEVGIEIGPNYYLFHMGLGHRLAGLGRYEEAVEALKRVATLARANRRSRGISPGRWALRGIHKKPGRSSQSLSVDAAENTLRRSSL